MKGHDVQSFGDDQHREKDHEEKIEKRTKKGQEPLRVERLLKSRERQEEGCEGCTERHLKGTRREKG